MDTAGGKAVISYIFTVKEIETLMESELCIHLLTQELPGLPRKDVLHKISTVKGETIQKGDICSYMRLMKQVWMC